MKISRTLSNIKAFFTDSQPGYDIQILPVKFR